MVPVRSLLPSFAESRVAMKQLLQQVPSDLHVGDAVFVNLRFFGDLTYQAFGTVLSDIHHTSYFMKWEVHSFNPNRRKVKFLFGALKRIYTLNGVDIRTFVHRGGLPSEAVLVDISFLRKYPTLHIP